jgi:hypothetical protein
MRVFELILPGVTAGGVPVGLMTIDEAAPAIDDAFNSSILINVFELNDPQDAWLMRPAAFGLHVDAQTSAQQAFDIGRSDNIIDDMRTLLATLQQGQDVTPLVVLDMDAARAWLDSMSVEVDVTPVEADLHLEEGRVVLTQSAVGKQLNKSETLDLLSAEPGLVMLQYRFLPLVMMPIAPLRADVSAVADELEGLLSSQPVLRAYDPVTDEHFTWTPSREEISSWLQLDREPTSIAAALDEAAVMEYVHELRESLGEERFFDEEMGAQNIIASLRGADGEALIIRYQTTSYVVQRGDTVISIGLRIGIPYWKILEFNPEVARYGLSVGEAITLPPKDAMLPLPVVTNKRIVIDISAQHMWVYQDGAALRDFVVSTGIASSPTMAGIFQVQEHILNAYASRWNLWMPHWLGIYKATPGLMNGIHGLPMLSSGVRLWANVLGRPASYGCIILDLPSAEWVYQWAEDGVVVEIRR